MISKFGMKKAFVAVWMLLAAIATVSQPAFAYYGPNDFAGINCSNAIDPDEVRFSQDSISRNFSDGQTVQSLIDGLNNGTVTAADVPPIRLVKVDPSQAVRNGGHVVAAGVYTLDNRRLYAFKQAGVNIRCTKVDPIPNDQRFKFTTDNDGTAIVVR
ncbi:MULTISPECIES: hypothetical protein [Thalassospira]|uniref:hypothetical protein n=1 Tax=Thalassospira TaxID=168934 RepID=UPI001ADBA1B8|nr:MULTISPECIES: hypothetical protein [Thalassospira]MBO9507712.1 hypothetical protein [Thalassospira sp. A3_1]WOI09247.1 hypothetical protein R1T41_11975 [Thalassospira lucentensis]